MRELTRLAPVRRRALIIVACGLVLAGCGGKTVSPVPQTVVGKVPTTPQAKGDPAAGSPFTWGAVGTLPSTVCGAGETVLPPEQPASTRPHATMIRARRRTGASLVNSRMTVRRGLRAQRAPGRESGRTGVGPARAAGR